MVVYLFLAVFKIHKSTGICPVMQIYFYLGVLCLSCKYNEAVFEFDDASNIHLQIDNKLQKLGNKNDFF